MSFTPEELRLLRIADRAEDFDPGSYVPSGRRPGRPRKVRQVSAKHRACGLLGGRPRKPVSDEKVARRREQQRAYHVRRKLRETNQQRTAKPARSETKGASDV